MNRAYELLEILDSRNVCLPALDIAGGQGDFLRGVLGACETARCPAWLLVYAPAGAYDSLEACAETVAFHAARASVPVLLHLDHGREEQAVEAALACGFDSVMFDGSALPLEENIRRTRAMAELAHARGAAIEGEIGRIGATDRDGIGTHALTDPQDASRFVRETGVDILAPAVGNAHGLYEQPPKLRFDLIEQIAAETHVPLSLHGGTGIPLGDVRRAGQLGMRKMNVATGLHRRFSDALHAAAAGVDRADFRWRSALKAAREAVRETALEIIRPLGCEGIV